MVFSLIESLGQGFRSRFFPRREEYLQWKGTAEACIQTELLPIPDHLLQGEMKKQRLARSNRDGADAEEEEVEEPGDEPNTNDDGSTARPNARPSRLLDLRGTVKKVTKFIRDEDDCNVFMYPVTREIAPTYFDKIQRPMDLTKMKRKAEEFVYLSTEEVCADVELMLQNCMDFNEFGYYFDVNIYLPTYLHIYIYTYIHTILFFYSVCEFEY